VKTNVIIFDSQRNLFLFDSNAKIVKMVSFIYLIEFLHWNWELANFGENAEKSHLFDSLHTCTAIQTTPPFGILY
jgi:hypothetical protein